MQKQVFLSWLEKALLIITLAVGSIIFVGTLPALIRSDPIEAWDTGVYYLAAHLVNEGIPLYNPAQMAQAAEANGIANHAYYFYPPFFAALFRPLAYLPYAMTIRLWLLLNLCFWAISLFLLTKIAPLPPNPLRILLGFLILIFPPTYATLLLGQVNFLLLLLITNSIYFSSSPDRRKQSLIGLFLGIAASIKLIPLVFGLPILLRRKFLAFTFLILAIFAASLFGIGAGGGLKNTIGWFSTGLHSTINLTKTSYNNLSIYAVLERPFRAEIFPAARQNTIVTFAPLINIPVLGTSLGLFLALVIGLTTLYCLISQKINSQKPSEESLLWDFALIISTVTLLSPVVEYHYYVWLLVPTFALLNSHYKSQFVRISLLLTYFFFELDRFRVLLITLLPLPFVLSLGFYGNVILWLIFTYIYKRRALRKELQNNAA